jgi:heptosyltransferase-2
MDELSEVKKILYITMSNLGDAIMALPAFDLLRRACPQAKITVVAGPRTRCIFENHPDVGNLIIYDKQAPLRQKVDLFFKLRRESFDVVVDLKDTFYRWGVRSRYKNPARLSYPSWAVHASQKYLFKAAVALFGPDIDEEQFQEFNARRNPSFISPKDQEAAEKLLEENRLLRKDEFILVAPGSRSDLKQWGKEGFIAVIQEIRRKYGTPVVIVGDKGDQLLARAIVCAAGEGVIDFSAKTDFGVLCSLVQRSKLMIGNDSGILQIASYLDKPVVGIYGPSDYKQYGPWSRRGLIVRKNILCAPCCEAHCRRQQECIKTITPYDVMLAVRLILETDEAKVRESEYRRILLVRTDRIGDVLISTPVIKALRDHYPASYIAMMVSPYTRELVEGNPYLDSVIVFDKDKKDAGFLGTLSFSNKLKKMKFDAVIVLHPTLRVHLICFLAGIRERIGYDRKAPYFLTKTFAHTKQEGRKHEVEYNFDLLAPLGIFEASRDLYMPIKETSERFVEGFLKDIGLSEKDKIVAVNPAASCISRRWPLQKFAHLIDQLITTYDVKVLIVADTIHRFLSEEVVRLAHTNPLDCSGRFNLSELASLIKRCALFISNDSGPVHIAVAVGTPVVAIFGRNQPGLSLRRWGPLGKRDVVLHKETNCHPCLAHDCKSQFKCLEAITVEEVLEHAGQILKTRQSFF